MSHCLPGGLAVEPLQQTLQQNRALHRSTTHAADVELYSSTALHISTSLQRSTLYILYTLPQSGERRHGHIRCRLGFQVVRMRRADGAALAVRRERLVSRSSLTLEPPLVVAPVGATAGGPLGISCQHPPEFPRIVHGSPRPCDASHGPSNTRLRFSPGRFRRRRVRRCRV